MKQINNQAIGKTPIKTKSTSGTKGIHFTKRRKCHQGEMNQLKQNRFRSYTHTSPSFPDVDFKIKRLIEIE